MKLTITFTRLVVIVGLLLTVQATAQTSDQRVLELQTEEIESLYFDLLGESSQFTIREMPWVGIQFRATKYREFDRWSPDIEIRLVYIGPADTISLSDGLMIESSSQTVSFKGGHIEISHYDDENLRQARVFRKAWPLLEALAGSNAAHGAIAELEFGIPEEALEALSEVIDTLQSKLGGDGRSWWRN